MSENDQLGQWLAEQGLSMSPTQFEQFDMYRALLQDWSGRMNLTAIRESDQIVTRHFIDSLTCTLATGELSGRRLIDVGTGAGFPGLPLKIFYPELSLTLTDSIGKKAAFLQAVVDALQLTGVTILSERAEDLGQNPDHREQYDWAVARSVAELRVLAEYLLPLVRVGGHALAQKGGQYTEEVAAARSAINTLGGELATIEMVHLPQVEEPHALMVIDKLTTTDGRYPRRAGIPGKRPL